MALHYDEEAIKIAFHLRFPDTYNPSDQRLIDFDEDLFERWDKLADEEMDAAHIPKTSWNRSAVVLLALMSSGGGVRLRMQNACRYYASVMHREL